MKQYSEARGSPGGVGVPPASRERSPPSTWAELYGLGGAAALVAAGLILAEVVAFALHPQPGTAGDWFVLFQNDRLLGLLNFWGLEVPMYLMFVPLFLALYVALGASNPARTAMGLTFALLGIGIFLATNNPFAMLSVSDQYAAATTEAQRASVLAAGQAVLAATTQRAVGGVNLGLFLVSVAGLIISSVMLQGTLFSRATAHFGLLAHALSLADYLRNALTASPLVALLVILPNAPFLVIWYALVGRRLYHLGRRDAKALRDQA